MADTTCERRIEEHPILRSVAARKVPLYWKGRELVAHDGETIAATLFAHGIRTFGKHPRDGSPQGIFCANGQCAQCLVLANGVPVKACMTPVRAGLHVVPLENLPTLPATDRVPPLHDIETIAIPVLILGGGPAGMAAAMELGAHGVDTLLVDDKEHLGGKLVLQTHRFFGSTAAVHAGTRGIDIARLVAREVEALPSVEVWRRSTALAVFSDGRVGILRDGSYVLVQPQVLLVATGAREKSLAFPGNTLPGVYGAGAFQTLVNRDLVRPADRLFVIGGGNVGLIAAYHALQAGIEVVGLAEVLPACGGYKVHRDKVARLGVPVYTSHTVRSANGTTSVESVTIAKVDARFEPVPGSERSFACDTLLIAVGLDPVDEFLLAAQRFGLRAWAAGDAEAISEASAAIYAGKIKGAEIASHLGASSDPVPKIWRDTAALLRARPGPTVEAQPSPAGELYPVFHCTQKIPCDPCARVCPQQLIRIDETDICAVPVFRSEASAGRCTGCARCVAICPGLAITLVDRREDPQHPHVTLASECGKAVLVVGEAVTVCDTVGASLGSVPVVAVNAHPARGGTVLATVRAPAKIAERIAGIRLQDPSANAALPEIVERLTDDAIVCRCERVTAGEIRRLIRSGCRDANEIKAITRAGMGACGGKTCRAQILRLFREEGVAPEEIARDVPRPLFVEVPLGAFAGIDSGGDDGPAHSV